MSKDIKVGDWVRVNDKNPKHYARGKSFQVTQVKMRGPVQVGGKRYATGYGAELGVWFKDLEKIDPPQPTTSIVEDIAAGVALGKVREYRKELIVFLETGSPDARPTVQAKISAVNTILDRLNA